MDTEDPSKVAAAAAAAATEVLRLLTIRTDTGTAAALAAETITTDAQTAIAGVGTIDEAVVVEVVAEEETATAGDTIRGTDDTERGRDMVVKLESLATVRMKLATYEQTPL